MARILVVHDDTAVLGAIKLVLERDGHEVVLAGSGRVGVSAVESNVFDVVICDIFMPGMDGIETIHAFRKTNPHMPVIAMSGFMFRDWHAPAPDFLSSLNQARRGLQPAQAISPAGIAQSGAQVHGERRIGHP